MGAFLPFAIALAAKGTQAYLSSRSKKKQAKEGKRSTTAALQLQHKQREDARRARLQTAASMLNGVPSTTAGGGVNTNVGLDPELLRQLNVERQYDFESAVPDETQGSTDAFLSGLFGGAGDVAGYYGAQQGGGFGGAAGAMTQGSGQGAGGLTFEDLMKLINTRKPTDGAGVPGAAQGFGSSQGMY